MASVGGFKKYLRKAFLFHWNLLALGVGTVAAFLSGRPDVVLPMVGAAEVLYLAGLATQSRFQQAVDAEEHKAAQRQETVNTGERAKVILNALGDQDRERFDTLRLQCANLRQIAVGVKGAPELGRPKAGPVDELHIGGVNRLLWIYLKLLYSKQALEKFFQTIKEREIKETLAQTQKRLGELGPAEQDTPTTLKRRKSLEDMLATSQARLDNFQRARENHEFILLELDRLYTKIASLAELGINRQDPEFISSEVDSVSASVQQTEKAMGELQFLTGLTVQDEAAPELLGGEQEVIGVAGSKSRP